MKIKQLYLKNFRGYSECIIPFNSDFNVIIGKNDIGKSTILEALEIFFNNEVTPISVEDLNVKATEKSITIGVSFEVDVDEEIIIDDTIKTTLYKESLLNSNGHLEIRKVWDCSAEKLSAKSLSTYIFANYYQQYRNNPLINMKISQLKEKCREQNLLECVKDSRVSSHFRDVLHSQLVDKTKCELLISVDGSDDAKKIIDKLNNEFPIFALFQSDRPNKDSDKDIQDPLKLITKIAIDSVRDKLDEIVKAITEKAKIKGENTLSKLAEMNPDIASSLQPVVKTKSWESLFSFSFNADDGIALNKRGSGVRRLVLLNFFRAESEDSINDKNIIYAIEEPETSQHPDYQKMIIESLFKLSKNEGRQVIITTHSPEIAKIAGSDNLIFIKRNEQKQPYVLSDENVKLFSIKEELGILPYLSRLVICVEGQHDISFINNINQNIPELKDIIDLAKEKISIIPMNGGNLKNWIDKDYLSHSNVKEFHLYDRDSNSGSNSEQYKEYVEKINGSKPESYAVLTNKREMENYIPKCLYEEKFPDKDCSVINDWDVEDLPTFFSNKKLDESAIKGIVNGQLSRKLTKELLESINAWDEVVGWFKKMKEMYEG